MFERLSPAPVLPSLPARFGIRSAAQLARDVGTVLRHLPRGDRYVFNLGSAALLRPDLSLPAWAGLVPSDGVAPIFNLFDRSGGGRGYRATVARTRSLVDYRGGRLSYDEHDGTDFVCPPGTPLCAAAPGIVVATRDRFLRGGLTVCVDHGDGVVTQYSHLGAVTVGLGERVHRGHPIAESGTSGFDLAQFFPFIPPHVHFMVWRNGRPMDPYRGPDEAPISGNWVHGNDPLTAAGELPGDPSPTEIRPLVDEAAVARALETCLDPALRDELEAQPDLLARVAVLEDSLHHDRPAWPQPINPSSLRSPGGPSPVRLTLPLPASLYRRARPADSPFTRP